MRHSILHLCVSRKSVLTSGWWINKTCHGLKYMRAKNSHLRFANHSRLPAEFLYTLQVTCGEVELSFMFLILINSFQLQLHICNRQSGRSFAIAARTRWMSLVLCFWFCAGHNKPLLSLIDSIMYLKQLYQTWVLNCVGLLVVKLECNRWTTHYHVQL